MSYQKYSADLDATSGYVTLTLACINPHKSDSQARTLFNKEIRELRKHVHLSNDKFATENHFERYRHSLTLTVKIASTRDLLALARFIAQRNLP